MCVDVRELEMESGSEDNRKETLKEKRSEGAYLSTCDIKEGEGGGTRAPVI